MTLASVFGGNIFNLFFGKNSRIPFFFYTQKREQLDACSFDQNMFVDMDQHVGIIFDSHSDKTPVGGRHNHECKMGLECYRGAYGLTLAAALVCFPIVLYCIWAKRNRYRV